VQQQELPFATAEFLRTESAQQIFERGGTGDRLTLKCEQDCRGLFLGEDG